MVIIGVQLYRRLDTNDYHDYHEFSSSGGCSVSWVTPYMLRCVFVTWPSLPIMDGTNPSTGNLTLVGLDEAQFFIGSESSMAGYYRWADQTDSADHPHGKVA